MKEQIEQAIQVLIGLPLWDARRTLNLVSFQFGARNSGIDEKGRTYEVGDQALHVQCAWRITGPSKIVVGSDDYYYPRGHPYDKPPDFDPNQPGTTRADEQLEVLFSESTQEPLIVEDVWVDYVGSVRIRLIGGYALEIFPDDSLDREHWRLFKPSTEEEHFVVTGRGIEEK